jgi:Notch-like protein
LAAREGSFEACKALLDNFANREIADHMERLPRDVASERLHHDIVRLLDSHVAHPNAQAMVAVNNNFMSKSQRSRVARPLVPLPKNTQSTAAAADIDLGMCLFTDSPHNIMSAHSNINIPGLKLNGGGGSGGSIKGKKRPKPSNPTSPADSIDSNVSLKRKNSVKKPPPPLPPSAAMSSTAAAPSNKKPFGLDVTCAGGASNMDLMALDVSRLYGGAGLPQQPPAYEECLSQLPAGSQRPMANYGAAMHHQQQQHQQQQQQHQQQQQQQQSDYRAIHQQLLSMQPSFQEPSPPHSVVMSPSPGKTRPSLPTSPTHMQALRHATMQAVDPFSQFHHFYGSAQQTPQSLQQPQSQHAQQYLTPPSDAAPESFPTPSPDSPWHWSSSSPNSNSDWSEGISSPPNNNNNNNNNGHPNKVSDAVYN